MRKAWLVVFFTCGICSASYRIYKLKIKHFDQFNRLERVELKYSILDPVQYETYYRGRIEVKMIDTWYCPGDTSNRRAFCRKPRVVKRETDVLPYNRQPYIP